MGYRRGFKTEANSTAAEVRGELGLGSMDALDPHRLARHLAVPVTALSELTDEENVGVAYYLNEEPTAFSAITVFWGTRRRIVHNDAHVLSRQRSNLAHELSHALLIHEPTPALDDLGCRLWNQDIEDEASWLAGVLLFPEDAAVFVARQRWSVESAAEHFGISTQMVNWRLRMTGALKRVERTQRLRRV